MKGGDYVELVDMLNTDEWRPLLPVILHLAWRQCSSAEQSHQLLTAFSKVSSP